MTSSGTGLPELLEGGSQAAMVDRITDIWGERTELLGVAP
jgi:hypothetical protein